jgi:hypothetical protein
LYQAVVATFSVVCAISSALTDISIFDLISYAKIELVIATNFEVVWKDEINSLGQSQRCFGNMQAHENVFKSFSFRDTMTFCGLVIAFNWIATACKVFVEFSQGPDLPSRLVNEVGSASFITTAAVAIMIFLKLAIDIWWLFAHCRFKSVFKCAAFRLSPCDRLVCPVSMKCLQVILTISGLSLHIFSALVILAMCCVRIAGIIQTYCIVYI